MIETLALVIGWTVSIVIGLLGLVFVWKVATDKININRVISEPDGSGASLSRLQFLIFTFVIAMSLFWVVVRQENFPEEIPAGVFILLGISGWGLRDFQGYPAEAQDRARHRDINQRQAEK